jgi:uncharacterized DUF497 family protein
VLQRDEEHIVRDQRRDYGEPRYLAFAAMRGRLHVIRYCMLGEGASNHQLPQGQ